MSNYDKNIYIRHNQVIEASKWLQKDMGNKSKYKPGWRPIIIERTGCTLDEIAKILSNDLAKMNIRRAIWNLYNELKEK